MPKLDRYLTREFTQSLFATLVVLGIISLGGVFADLLGEQPVPEHTSNHAAHDTSTR